MTRTIELEVDDETLAAVRQDAEAFAAELRAAGAAKLYELGRVSQERAAQIAGLSRREFVQVLAGYRVTPFQDTQDSLREEMSRG